MSCQRCKGALILAQHKLSLGVCAFRCLCDTKHSKDIPMWHDKLALTYEVDFMIQYQPDKKSLAANDKPEQVDDFSDIPF